MYIHLIKWKPKFVVKFVFSFRAVADPGFDLRGGVDFVNGGWGGGRKSSESVEG